MTQLDRDVVIVGAGVAGLTVATQLKASGLTVAVLEARDRVGGRLWTRQIEGQLHEIGGQWVSPEQDALLATLAELGLATFPRFREGASIYVGPDRAAQPFTGDDFPVPASTRAEITRLTGLLDDLVAQTDPEAPWAHPRAHELDAVSLTSWLEASSSDRLATDTVALFLAGAMLTKPPHAFSVLQAMLMAASAGSFSTLVDADVILDRRVIGGLQQVPLLLARDLGDDVHLGAAVKRLEWNDDGVTASTSDLTVTARRVVVAVPPNLYGRIDFAPALPALRQQAHQHLSIGLVIKVHATYETPFWRDRGLSGTAFGPYELVHEAYDNSVFEDSRGMLVGFVSDENADELITLDPPERRRRILESLAAYYGPQALEPIVYFESDWASEEWTRGAYATSYDIGGLSRFGALQREPVGAIRFASSDLAGEGYQHVDGAIRVARTTAEAIVRDLGA